MVCPESEPIYACRADRTLGVLLIAALRSVFPEKCKLDCGKILSASLLTIYSAAKGYGYFEDRRPASNADPYRITGIIVETYVLSEPLQVP